MDAVDVGLDVSFVVPAALEDPRFKASFNFGWHP
jgi:hypothetical protein